MHDDDIMINQLEKFSIINQILIPSFIFSQVGDEGAGHFVKMVHNGIEYGDMQLICEAYNLMHDILKMSCDEMSQVRSWLISCWVPC